MKRREHTDRVVYVWFYPADHRRAGQPCYVGQGAPKRPYSHADGSTNATLRAIFKNARAELPVVIIRTGLTREQACEIEVALIRAIGRADRGAGPLVNHSDGGEGIIDPSPEAREKMRKAKLGTIGPRLGVEVSEDTRALMRANRQGFRWWHIPDGRSYKAREKRDEFDLPGRGASYVNRHSPRPGLSLVLTGRQYSEAHCAAISRGKQAAAMARKAAAIEQQTRHDEAA